jgi:hypothetical protein
MNDRGYRALNLSKGDGWFKRFHVHYLVALTFMGERPPDWDIHHIDSNPSNNCVENLQYHSHTDNMRACAAAGRHHHGDQHTQAILSDEKVREIRRLSADGVSCIDLMERYGVERKTLYNARKGVTWKHVK